MMVVQEWQLALAVAALVISGIGLLFALWKFVDYKITQGDNKMTQRLESETATRDQQIKHLHDRINGVKETTPSHDDIKRVEGYLERISSRIDQLVTMVVDYGSRNRDDHK